MKKTISILAILFSSVILFAVHNFTLNQCDTLQVSIGDTLWIEFDYETEGASATMEIIIYVSTFDFPTITPENVTLTDGGSLDETGVDGHFKYHFENFLCLPQTSSLRIKLTDNDVSDEVKLTFIQLDTNFSVSGKILKEQEHISTAVRGAFVYSFYNSDRDELHSLFDNPTAEDFMDYMQENRYFISVLSNNSGEYQIFLPEDIPNVPCTVDVFSALDTNKEKVAPETEELTVNGNLTNINLIYQNPDGYFKGNILNSEGDSLKNCSIIIKNSDTTRTVFTFSDSLGAFEIPLLNDDYNLKITKPGYQEYHDNFTIQDQDYIQNIILQDEITTLEKPSDIILIIRNDSIFIQWTAVNNALYYSIYSSENPFTPLILWQTEVDSTSQTVYQSPIIQNKKFYFIKAKR